MARRRYLISLVVSSLVLASCAANGSAKQEEPAEGGLLERSEVGEAEVREIARASVALVETPLGTGSAVLVDRDYLVTSAAVVDPFRTVDVTFERHATLADVRVAGVDLVNDVAVLGPVTTSATPITMIDPSPTPSDLSYFSVGFPGVQASDAPDLQVLEGDFVDLRSADGFDAEFLESAAFLGEGQAGGLLIDSEGRAVGMSSLAGESRTTLSLVGTQVLDARDRIVAGDGSADWETIAPAAAEQEVATYSESRFDVSSVYFPPTDAPQSIEVAVDGPAPLVAVGTPGRPRTPWGANGAAADDMGAEESYWYDGGLEVVLDEVSAGRWAFGLSPYEDAIVMVSTASNGSDMRISASEPMVTVDVDGFRGELVLDAPVDVTVNYVDAWVYYGVWLEEGEAVEVSSRSLTGDTSWAMESVEPCGAEFDPHEAFDGGGGLLDLDAVATVDPACTGWYGLWIYNDGGSATEATVQVSTVS